MVLKLITKMLLSSLSIDARTNCLILSQFDVEDGSNRDDAIFGGGSVGGSIVVEEFKATITKS